MPVIGELRGITTSDERDYRSERCDARSKALPFTRLLRRAHTSLALRRIYKMGKAPVVPVPEATPLDMLKDAFLYQGAFAWMFYVCLAGFCAANAMAILGPTPKMNYFHGAAMMVTRLPSERLHLASCAVLHFCEVHDVTPASPLLAAVALLAHRSSSATAAARSLASSAALPSPTSPTRLSRASPSPPGRSSTCFPAPSSVS